MHRRKFLGLLCGAAGMTAASGWRELAGAVSTASAPASASQPRSRTNVLLITADDMNWDAVGAFGCPVAGTTPNIDRLAAEGMRFEHAHVTISVCQPSRSHAADRPLPAPPRRRGLLPPANPGRAHPSGGAARRRLPRRHPRQGLALHPLRRLQVGYLLRRAGPRPRPQPRHLPPARPEAFFSGAVQAGQPFFLMANSHDPHRPFYGNDLPHWYKPCGELPGRRALAHLQARRGERRPASSPTCPRCARRSRSITARSAAATTRSGSS